MSDQTKINELGREADRLARLADELDTEEANAVADAAVEAFLAAKNDRPTYSDAQATDEAVLLLMRKMHRLYPAAHSAILTSFPEDVRDALTMAELRADRLRAHDQRDGIERAYLVRDFEISD